MFPTPCSVCCSVLQWRCQRAERASERSWHTWLSARFLRISLLEYQLQQETLDSQGVDQQHLILPRRPKKIKCRVGEWPPCNDPGEVGPPPHRGARVNLHNFCLLVLVQCLHPFISRSYWSALYA